MFGNSANTGNSPSFFNQAQPASTGGQQVTSVFGNTANAPSVFNKSATPNAGSTNPLINLGEATSKVVFGGLNNNNNATSPFNTNNANAATTNTTPIGG